MGKQIILYGNMAEQKFEEIGQIFTKVKDQLEILKTEAEGLNSMWQGEAETHWGVEFERRHNNLRAAISACQKNIAIWKQVAGELAEEEKKIQSELNAFF